MEGYDIDDKKGGKWRIHGERRSKEEGIEDQWVHKIH